MALVTVALVGPLELPSTALHTFLESKYDIDARRGRMFHGRAEPQLSVYLEVRSTRSHRPLLTPQWECHPTQYSRALLLWYVFFSPVSRLHAHSVIVHLCVLSRKKMQRRCHFILHGHRLHWTCGMLYPALVQL